MSLLNSIIVEDEEISQQTLKNLLTDYCEGIKVTGIASTVDEAVKLIIRKKPDVVFLDIELPEKNGFQLLEYFPEPDFHVIFTTAYNQFAIKAFKFSAVDYLLKPIDLQELRLAIEKVTQKQRQAYAEKKYQQLLENLNHTFEKITIPSSSGFIFIELKNLVRCEANGNYTNFLVSTGEKYIASQTLGVYDEILTETGFFRINRKDLININHIHEFRRQKKAMIQMSDGSLLPLTASRKEAFLKIINPV